ncbi:hypothetical protein LZZ85_26495 [Terrimonas sp. NA20]|uniref:Uncharacterized protein n=1 Tax=Terrimonas ginsenosidimutans TaxID=2908004 RepID=A0ABS9KZT7_9BACT|nr:hypothetical protein [Terrimonas ginsenosidimutans]MCG2617879.1 hypothetical protein [Terrimonas ginsenosidimutans]
MNKCSNFANLAARVSVDAIKAGTNRNTPSTKTFPKNKRESRKGKISIENQTAKHHIRKAVKEWRKEEHKIHRKKNIVRNAVGRE